MLIDTNEIINSEQIYIKIVFKDGNVIEKEIPTIEIKSIDFKMKNKEFRNSIWEELNKDDK